MSRRAGRLSVGRLARLRRASAVVAVACLAATAASVPATSSSAAAADDPPAYTMTQTLTREHTEADGTVDEVDSRDVTVTVDHTQNLRGRERVTVSWSGARPSAGRAANPYGEGGLYQEYPVVILQCRGLDDPDLPKAEQLQPETCWTTSYMQRYAIAGRDATVWQHDMHAAPEDVADPDPATWPSVCTPLALSFMSAHLLPFVAANGTSYPSCTTPSVPPESAVDAALLAADTAAFTSLDGTGTVEFEVRSDTENESLGCSADVPCSLVVIPIMGISCDDANAECRKDGAFEPGASNYNNMAVDPAVSPVYWWSESNWRGRFSVPLTFGLPPNACNILDNRAPVDIYGSELLAQASLQWAPAYCLRADRFKFRHNAMAESTALHLLGTGEAVAAFVSEPAEPAIASVAYAPVAVSGFAISYVVDLPDNAGALTTMRLSPRLLAKLLTQSYPGSYKGRGHPGLETNPLSLNRDEEFIALNPGLSDTVMEAAATLMSLSTSSDTIMALTEYIAADAEAMAFVEGEPDPWGMVVNPSYAGIDLPRKEWPLLDTWVPPTEAECEKQITTPYLTRIAAPVLTLRKIAEASLDGWPLVQTTCTRSTTSDPWKIGRGDRQPYGQRFMLGLVSLGDAERYGLSTAELRTSGTGTDATFVAASEASMIAALPAASQSAPGQPFVIDRAELAAGAYPGTMIVHTAARMTGLTAANADYVAQFIRVATSEGQQRGSANGELPAGFVPIVSTGATAALHASAQAVATAIDGQTGTMVPASNPGTGGGTTPLRNSPTVPAATTPGTAPTVSGLPAAEDAEEAQVLVLGSTATDTSAVAQSALPMALALVLIGALATPVLRLATARRRLR